MSEMEERLRLQRVHCDEIEKELEQASKERLTQERMLQDSRIEREQAKKAVELMKTQVNDYQSQVNEYKAIIKRMSALRSGLSMQESISESKFMKQQISSD